jgi:hypothetical protein
MSSPVTAICPYGSHEFTYQPKRGNIQVYCCADHRNKARYERSKQDTNERRCARCGKTKPRSAFTSTHGYCRPCHAAYSVERKAIRDAEMPDYSYMINLRRYGLTLESFAALLASQDGKCKICGIPEPGGQGRWHVDHDHSCCSTRKISCGKCIRGLLCTRCNIGVGNFADSPERLRAAANYLEAHAARRAAHPVAPAV